MKYYLINTKTGICIEFKNFEKMIIFFGRNNQMDGKKIYNPYFDDISMNGKDTKLCYNKINEYILLKRELMLFDQENKIIDPRNFKEQIFNYKDNHYRIWSSFKKWETFIFRRGSVPHIHNHKNSHWGCYYKRPKTTGEKRLSGDPEIKQYVKPSRNFRNIPNSYDEIIRFKDRCWKNKKIKKQWMKNFKNSDYMLNNLSIKDIEIKKMENDCEFTKRENFLF